MDAQMVFTAFKISLVRNKNLEGLTVSPMIELRKQINTEQSKFGGATLSLSACSVYHVSWLFHSQNSCLAKKVKVKSLSHVQLLGTPRTVAYLLLHPTCSSVHGIFQARVPEWVAISFSRGSSWPRDRTHVFCISCTSDEFFTAELLGKPSWVQEALITIESSQRELAMIWGSNSNLDKPI